MLSCVVAVVLVVLALFVLALFVLVLFVLAFFVLVLLLLFTPSRPVSPLLGHLVSSLFALFLFGPLSLLYLNVVSTLYRSQIVIRPRCIVVV